MKRRKNEPFTFTVEGEGIFPFDMLRYDSCWPFTEQYDSSAMRVTMYGEVPKLRRVVLVTKSENSPTPARWESFGWAFIGYGDCRDDNKYRTLPRDFRERNPHTATP